MTGQVRLGQVRTGQVRTGQVRTDQVRQVKSGQVKHENTPVKKRSMRYKLSKKVEDKKQSKILVQGATQFLLCEYVSPGLL